GLPTKRALSRTSTSEAKTTASAASMTEASIGVVPLEPCVSATTSMPSSEPAATRASAAMYVWAMPVGQAVTATTRRGPSAESEPVVSDVAAVSDDPPGAASAAGAADSAGGDSADAD